MRGLWRLSIGLLAGGAAVLAAAGGAALAQERSAADTMSDANDRYERGDFAGAVQAYEDLIEGGYEDAALYYNAGNAYFKMGDLGRAILNYLRAQDLSPRDPDIRANLELARSRTIDQIEGEDSLIASISAFGRGLATAEEIGIVALALWVCSALGMGAAALRPTMRLRALVRGSSIAGMTAALFSLLLLSSMLYANPNDDAGIITAQEIDVLSGPGAQYPTEFTLHSGAQVRIVEFRQGWRWIALPGGDLQGWIPSDAIELAARRR